MYAQGRELSLLEQKRLQWAREREEMVGLSGLWGALDKNNRDISTSSEPILPRRNSLLPPIQTQKSEEQKEKEEESETSGYLSDSPQHECDSSIDSRSHVWSAKKENYWGERKAQKNLRNERRMRGTPDSVLSTPDDRSRWGDRGVGVGHLWEPVVEMPDSRLPQVFESYRATPRWLEKKLADNSKADILVIQHDEEEKMTSNFLLGQNTPLCPEVLEERERKRKKALELQNAIRRQLEEREKRRKEEKEMKMQEEKREEERIAKERELERLRRDEEMRRLREKEDVEKRKGEAMKEALEEAERKAREDKKIKKELIKVNEVPEFKRKEEPWKPVPHVPREKPVHEVPRKEKFIQEVLRNEKVIQESPRSLKDSSCQAEEEISRQLTDSCVQAESTPSLQFLNMGGVTEGGLALVLEGSPAGGVFVPQDAVQLLLMSPGQAAGALPVQMPMQISERVLTPSKLRGARVVADATTQTDRKCCSVALSTERSRRCYRRSGRSESSEKSSSMERLNTHGRSHNHCTSRKYRSRSSPRASLGDRPKWGINRPTVQYMKQSEKDPHYLRRLKRRRTKEAATCMGPAEEKLLESEFRLLPLQTDEDELEKEDCLDERILKNGFRMVSNPSSPKFVRIDSNEREFEVIAIECLDEGVQIDNEVTEMHEEVFREVKSESEVEITKPEDLNQGYSVVEVGISSENEENVNGVEESTQNDEAKNWTTECQLQDDVIIKNEIVEVDKEELELPPQEDLKLEELQNEESSSAPSTGRSAEKSDENDGDVDVGFDEEEDDEDNKSVVSASLVNPKKAHMEIISQIAALRMGLQRLMKDTDESRCTTPGSSIGEFS